MKTWLTTVSLVVFLILLATSNGKPTKVIPVILIPGDGGSQFMAKLAKPQVVHYFCDKTTDDYFSIWLNLELLAPYILDCTIDNLSSHGTATIYGLVCSLCRTRGQFLVYDAKNSQDIYGYAAFAVSGSTRLVYDTKTRTTSNSPGVDIRTVNFGSTEGVEFLDPSQLSVSSYFAPLAKRLVDLGYVKGQNLMAAPYDFRKAPNELGGLFKNLSVLFETSYQNNGEVPALAVAHSLGNMVFTYFMSTKSDSWKQKYVHGYVALAAPLAGAAKLWRLYASGDTLNEPFVNPLSIRAMQRTFPSSAFLMPYAGKMMWPEDTIVVFTPNRNYTVKDIQQFSTDINYPILGDLRKNTENLVDIHSMHPGVDVYCIHGWNIDTPEQFTYTGSMFPNSQPYVKTGEGDGTVNGISLKSCDIWNTTRHAFDHHYVMTGGEHMAILGNPEFVNYVTAILGFKQKIQPQESVEDWLG